MIAEERKTIKEKHKQDAKGIWRDVMFISLFLFSFSIILSQIPQNNCT